MADFTGNKLPERIEIDDKYKWKLEDIYESQDKWEEDYKKIKVSCEEILKYRGRLNEGPETLFQCLSLSDSLLSLNDNIYVYARMKRDEDNTNPVYQALADRAAAIGTEVYAAVSYITPEIISISEETLNSYIESSEPLKIYRQFLYETLRQKKHILSDKEEEILALSYEVSSAPRDIFTMFNNADIRFPFIKDENGEEVELTKGRYITFMESKDRRVRKDAFDAFYEVYNKQKNTLAASLSSNTKANKFYSAVRKYDSSIEASLDEDNIPVKVYDSLIETVNNNLGLLHRYLKLRKKVLNLDELHMYDLYVPIVEQPKRKYRTRKP
jgi:oligoendopeptidase F